MLPPPVVVIEQGPDVPAELHQAVLDGCTQGLGPGACVDQNAENEGSSPYRADVAWSGDFLSVQVLLWLGPEAETLERTLQFHPHDRPNEKGAAAGLVTATAVATHLALRPPEPPKTESPPEVPTEPEPQPQRISKSSDETNVSASPQTSALHLRADASFLLGSSLREGPLAIGGTARASMSGWGSPLFPLVAISYSQSGGDFRAARWRTWLGLGIAVDLQGLPLSMELSGAGVGESLTLRAKKDKEVEKATKLRLGALAETDLIWRATEGFHYFFGGQVSASWPDVEIREESQPVDAQEVFGWNAVLGIRVRL